MRFNRIFRPITVFTLILCSFSIAHAATKPACGWTWWRVRDMRWCAGKPEQVKFDGKKSVISLSKDQPCTLVHDIRYTDLSRDSFVLRFGKVSPGVKWQVWVSSVGGDRKWHKLMSGTGGGTHRAPFSNTRFPRWLYANLDLRLWSEKPATVEILSWEIEKPGVDPWAELRKKTYKQLVKANPIERGLVPYWNPNIGAFVCTYNTTHPERYNFWLEDEGEMLWGMGNYPDLMAIYGKGMRDFIVDNCKAGAPVRRVNDQPLLIYEPPSGGKFRYDTGILYVEGDLSADPRLNLYHSTYESGLLLAALAGFYVTYEDAQGTAHRIDFTKPHLYNVRYDAPKRDQAKLLIQAVDSQVTAAFTIIGYRGGVRINARVVNPGDGEIRKVNAGFELRDCDKYYRSPLNRLSQFGDVAILWSEQPRLEFCNLVRLAGPAACEPILERKDDNIVRAGFSAELAERVAKGSNASLELANVQAASRSFAEKIEIYKDIDFKDADISTSFVSTYALLGLATYSYRYPEDKEARQVVDLMTDNFFGARERLRNRELGYLMWVLSLIGRDADANAVADLVEKRAAVDKYTPLDMAGMAIGLRKVGRWEAADRICLALDKTWDGVAAPADYLGLGALRSPELNTRCLKQLSLCLRQMAWEPHYPAAFPANAMIQEGVEETQAYALVVLDLISRTNGGIVPQFLDPDTGMEITHMSFDEKTRECRIGVTKAGKMDIYTHYRRAIKVLWNGKPLDKRLWRYNPIVGMLQLTGLSGEGELTISVIGPCPKDKWTPMDYIGLAKRS